MINLKQLTQSWVHSVEEQKPDDNIQIYRPRNTKEFPPSRFRMKYIFSVDQKCHWYYLAPNDGHHFREGTWKFRDDATNIIDIQQGNATVSYQIIELTQDVLCMLPI